MNEFEIIHYDLIIARCLTSAIKYVVWWFNNIGGGCMLITDKELHEAEELAIALSKRNITLNLNCNNVQKELYKTTAEQYFKNDAERLKQNLQEVLPKQYCFRHPTL